MMATKLQIKGCLPGYSFIRDLNEDPSSNWSRYCVEKKVNDHLYDNYMQMSVNGYSAYDKEMLKQTMLEHEEIFRKQVYELHRLYRIQRDMMYEFQTRALHLSGAPEETSQSNSFSSLMRSENSQMFRQPSHFPAAKSYCVNLPYTGTHDMKAPMSFMKEGSIQSGLVPVKNSSSFKESEFVDYKVENQSRRMLDLDLPADAYSDLNGRDTSERKDAVELSAYKTEIPSCTSNPQCTAKLILDKGPEESAFVQFLGKKTQIERNLEHHLTIRSYGKNEYGLIDKLPVTNFRCSSGGTNGQFPNFTNDDPGRGGKGLDVLPGSHYSERFPVPYGPLQLNLKNINGNHTLDSNNLEAWFKQKTANDIEISARGSHAMISSNSGSVFPFVPASFPVPMKNFTSSSSSFVLSGKKPLNGMSDLLISARELPSINTSSNISTKSAITNVAPQNVVASSKIWQKHDNLTSGQGITDTGPHHRFDLNSSDAQPLFQSDMLKCMDNTNSSINGNVGHQTTRSVKDFQYSSLPALGEINLNQVPSAIDDDLREQDGLVVQKKSKDLSGAPFWLRKTECLKQSFDLNLLASDMESSFSDDQCNLPNVNFSIPRTSKEEKGIELSVHGLNDSLQAIGQKMQLDMPSEHTNKRPYNFVVPEKAQQICLILSSVPQAEKSLFNNLKCKDKDELLFNNLDFDQEISCSKELSAESFEEKGSTSHINSINLNVGLPSCAEETLPNKEIPFQIPNYYKAADANESSMIDLEMPICQCDGSAIPKDEIFTVSESNYFKEKESDTVARLAAENIVAISSHKISYQDEVHCYPISPCDSLHFFVEVALSINEGTKSPRGFQGGCSFVDGIGLDPFEAMTLALEEVKVHDVCNKTNSPVNKGETDEEDIGVASQLFTRRRRGQARRRRQRKDFQKDILPSLASLSRHEVVEDLQLIGEMMKASGGSWQLGLGRRNSGRNGAKPRTKGKRQIPTNCSETVAETHTDSYSHPPAQSNINEPEVVGSSMIGWGRTTRRCRRQRSPPSNVVSSLA